MNSLPTDAAARKAVPLASGCLDYFPAALAAVAALSQKGNDQHNPGQELFWDRAKSGDEGDALLRHFLERGTVDTDGVRHSAKVAWRALALLQKELEAEEGAPLPRAVREYAGWLARGNRSPAYDAHPFLESQSWHGAKFIPTSITPADLNPVSQSTGD